VSLAVRTTPGSDAQIREIDDWWRSNRLYRRSPIPRTRRLLLAVSRYHVYYVPQADDVKVLAVWHARRGVGPPLRIP